MNYQAHYDRLMLRAVGRVLVGYSEKHHVLPKCLGGGNSKDNLVRLTPEEHYVAHLLLVKLHPGHFGLLWSAMAMTNHTKRMGRQNKVYGWLRRRFAERIGDSKRGGKASPETVQKMIVAKTGTHWGFHTEATKLKMNAASKGKPKSEAHRAALSVAKTGTKRPPRSDEWRQRQSAGIKAAFAGKDYADRRTPEYRAKQSAQSLISWARRKEGVM